MNTLRIDPERGILTIDGFVIAPLGINEFLTNIALVGSGVTVKTPNIGFSTYCLEGKLGDEAFGVNITYEEGQLESVWLAWAGGISGVKGYETSEAELVKDKCRLSKLISKHLGKQPDEVSYNHDVFRYDWGVVSVACSIRATIVTVGVRWAATNHP